MQMRLRRRARLAALAAVVAAFAVYSASAARIGLSFVTSHASSCPIAVPFSPIASPGGDISVMNASGSAIVVDGYDDNARAGLSSGRVEAGDTYVVHPTIGEVVVVVDLEGRCLVSATATASVQTLKVSSFHGGGTAVLPVFFAGATGESVSQEVGPIDLRSAQDPAAMRWPARSQIGSVLKSGRGAAIFYSFADVKLFLGSLNARGARVGAALLQAADGLDWSSQAIVAGYVVNGGASSPLIREVAVTGTHAVVTLVATPPCFGYVSSDGKPPTPFDCLTMHVGGKVASFVFATVGRTPLAPVKQVTVVTKASSGFP